MLSLWLAATTAETPPVPKPIGAPCFPTAGGGDIFAGLDLTGKTALVTGSNGGIGSEIAVALAAHGAQVILTWRKAGDCLNQTLAIKKRVPNAYLKCPDEPLDLSSFSVVRKFAKQFPTDLPIDMLINDAAMPNNLHGITTIDGMEMAFQVDYASTWLLTDLLLPQVRVAKGRVINLVSKAYRTACLMSKRFDCAALKRLPPPVIQPPNSSVPILNIPVTNYGIAKLLMVRWTEDLARREALAGTGVTVYSVDPGFVNTSMSKGSNLSPYFKKLACTDEGRTGAPCPTNASQGALTPVFLAIAPEQYLPAKDSSGKFFEWCAQSKVEKCIALDHGKLQCQLALQSEQEALWNLTAKWVANFTDSGNTKPEPPAPAPKST